MLILLNLNSTHAYIILFHSNSDNNFLLTADYNFTRCISFPHKTGDEKKFQCAIV